MKFEFTVAGKVIVIEADGAVSVVIRDDLAAAPTGRVPGCAPSAPVVPPVPACAPATAPPGELFARLSELRRAVAAEQGVPPYVVFKDASLREMAERMPVDLDAFSQIGGVGASKLEKYGNLFLEVIQGAA